MTPIESFNNNNLHRLLIIIAPTLASRPNNNSLYDGGAQTESQMYPNPQSEYFGFAKWEI
jgi:hypothetical protein